MAVRVDVRGALATRPIVGERSPLRHVDATLVFAALGLCALGLMMVYSATHRSLQALGQSPGYYLRRQAIFLVFGVVAMALTAAIDYRIYRIYAPFLYAGAIFFLLLVRSPLGSSSLGAQRWFQIGGFQFSPSLFARLALIGMLAAVLATVKGEMTFRDVGRAVLVAAVPMLLVFVQPDIGTTIVLAAILVTLLVVSGVKARYLVALALAAVLGIFGAFQLHVVKEYQVQRLAGFLDPSKDLQRSNYNRNQAEIAIGSGGLTGKGYLHGSQTNLDFVPEQHTDFIFTVVGEELGFLGGLLVLGLFGLLLWRAFRTALLAKDPFGTFLCVGVASMIAVQLFVNVGMTLGIMPITGIPLPFISYGGSGLIADLIGVGLLLNVHMRRFV
jgi:rod shape determining protein RodA